MTITRTVALDDLTAAEMAERFCEMNSEQQAAFFSWVGEIARTSPGAGMRMPAQAHAIAKYLGPDARYVIECLADHAGLIPAQVAS